MTIFEQRPPAIFVMGPTAAGKTDLALALCEHLPCDIISVDSAMIYRGMDIGTAKPSAGELARAPHRLIDICDPAERYSAADFCGDARTEMAAIAAAGRIPLLVGGTMMYFKALLSGIADMPAADPGLRRDLEERAQREGWAVLHRELEQRDAVAAKQIHPHNRQRVLRALEVVMLSGKPISEAWAAQHRQGNDKIISGGKHLPRWRADAPSVLPYNVVQFAIASDDRAVLHRRIADRFEKMLAHGFLAEVKVLHSRADLHRELPSMRCVGYRQAWAWLERETEYETFVQQGIAATRQLAKRQLTWLRKWQGVDWLTLGNQGNVSKALKIAESRTTLN
jgi:tRNA dimethylallyltransferase